MLLLRKYLFLFLFLILITGIMFIVCPNFSQNTYNSFLNRNNSLIVKVCKKYSIDELLFKSVIYGELINNYDVFDKMDNLRAELGYDASIGECQIKISTAQWIEKNLANKYKLRISSNREELLKYLQNPEKNIQYSCIYIKSIHDTLYHYFNTEPSVLNIASYYSYGIDFPYRKFSINYRNIVGDSAYSYYLRNK